MFSRRKIALLVTAALLAGCGGGGRPAPRALHVRTVPSDGVAYVGQASPWNQVSFTAYLYYSDGSTGTDPVSGVQWTADPHDYWVVLNGNMAVCFQASLSRALIHATATVNGATLNGVGTMWCT